jgi:UDP-GlcNAc:undecaprenyl-phosphate GlcNAc-1-phosphate transferase
MREYALVLLVTAAVTYLLIPLVRRIAVRTHAMHAPRARDVHTTPTPLLGGLAMYGGLLAGLLFASRLTYMANPFEAAGQRTEKGLVLAGAIIVVIGFIDDRWGLSAISKLAGQVAAAGILFWSGQSLPWLPMPNGRVFSLGQDLSLTLTILLVVVTINAINFIDGLDGLAAGITAVAALSFLVYSYSLPAVSSALLAGMCLGFLPHNFYPARIFMGDTGAMLLGLLLAYGPISSTNSLDPALLSNYAHYHAANRFGTILPLLVPAAIFLIPYTDLMLAVIRRTRRGKPVMTADREHLHHRLLGIGHSYRQSVLIMWLWAALFSVTVVSLSLVRTQLWILSVATVVAVLTLLPVTMPRLRPWRLLAGSGRTPVQVPVAAPSAPHGSVGRHGSVGAQWPAAGGAGRTPAGRTPSGGGHSPAGNGAPSSSAFMPANGANGANGTRLPVNGDPPPGFEPLIPPPAGNGSIPGPSPAERALRPFPGDADLGSRPGPGSGSFYGMDSYPAQESDDGNPFSRTGTLPDDGDPAEPGQQLDATDRFADTEPFPASPQPHPDPRPR